MGKPGFLSFFVVLAEISSGVNKFFWNDWGHDVHGVPQKKMGSARRRQSSALPSGHIRK